MFSSDEFKSSLLLLEDLWWKGDQIAVPADARLRQHIIREAHDTASAGHFDYSKTLQAVQRNFNWPHMAADILEYVQGCHMCQRNKNPSVKPAGLLQPIGDP